MTEQRIEEVFNQQYQEVAKMVTQAREHLTALEQRLTNIYAHTTQYRLEQEQRQLREEYYSEDNSDNSINPNNDGIRFKYTLV